MPTVHVNDIGLYYQIHGEGEPLVLISGLGVGLWIWAKQVPAFSRRFQTIVFDNRGAGQSDKPNHPYSIKLMADDVAGLLGAVGGDRAHILGTSLGGFVAQEFALSYPHMTRSLILCCTSFGGANHVLPAGDSLQAMASTDGLNTEERARKQIQFTFSQRFANEQPEEVDKIIRLRLANPISEEAYLNQLQAAMGFNAEARVSAINAPTLVITGDQDVMVPAENSRNLAAKIPHAKLLVIEGAGHGVFIERADEFNQAVIDFLEAVGRGD